MSNMTDILSNPEDYLGGFLLIVFVVCMVIFVLFGRVIRR